MPVKNPNGVATVEVSAWRTSSRAVKVINVLHNAPVRITPKRIYWSDKFFDHAGKCLSARFIGGYHYKILKYERNANLK